MFNKQPETINFNDFLNGDWKEKKAKARKEGVIKVVTASNGALILLLPKSVLAASASGTFGNVHDAVMRGFDAGVVLIIIFSGAAWSLGHRSKALEILIGVCAGYLLARHAIDIRDFLKGI